VVLGTLVGALLLAACGDDSDEPAATAPPPTAATEPTETVETPTGETIAAIRETPLTAKLDSGYRVENGSISNPDEGDLPVAPGSVEAHWYKSEGRWVVVYTGVPKDPGPICPGNSILVGTSYESVSNAPIEEGVSCGSSTLAVDPAGLRWCGPHLVYVTEIPASKTGALSASIEQYEGAVILGVTGMTSTDFGEAPKVELSELGC
jgi:hypothetical protein